MQRALRIALIAIGILTAVVAGRAFLLDSRQGDVPAVTTIEVDSREAARRLAGALAFETISYQDPAEFDGAPFLALHAYLQRSYPLVHRSLEREIVASYSLLYHWPGRDPSLDGVLLMSHLDVVPVEPGTEDSWTRPPFAGAIAEGYVWGRGAMDNKVSTTAPLEAIEALIDSGFSPERTVYLGFGHDEELGGAKGAAGIAALLEDRGVRLVYTLDEGSGIVPGLIPGIEQPVALIGLAEKGGASLRLTVRMRGGHAMAPPSRSTIGSLSRAVAALEANPMPANLSGLIGSMLDFLTPEMDLGMRLVFANRWLAGPLILRRMEKNEGSNAMLRSTFAPTMIAGGIKENVLPSQAHAVVNARILPGDSIDRILAHVRAVIDDPNVKVEVMRSVTREPSRVSSVRSPGFATIRRSIREVFSDVLVAPCLVIGGTDSRHYEKIATDAYRFIPWRVQAGDLSRIHGRNERLSVENYAEVIRFYGQVIRNSAGAQ